MIRIIFGNSESAFEQNIFQWSSLFSTVCGKQHNLKRSRNVIIFCVVYFFAARGAEWLLSNCQNAFHGKALAFQLHVLDSIYNSYLISFSLTHKNVNSPRHHSGEQHCFALSNKIFSSGREQNPLFSMLVSQTVSNMLVIETYTQNRSTYKTVN